MADKMSAPPKMQARCLRPERCRRGRRRSKDGGQAARPTGEDGTIYIVPYEARLNSSTAFWPPKPKVLHIAYSPCHGCALFGT